METKAASVQTQKGLSVVQFYSSNMDTFDYVSLGKAANEKMIELVELKEGASVNDIHVINHSDKFIFLMDGDIIEGAKQNRVINTSILLAPKVKTQIKVSCVEHGRWRHNSDNFKPGDYTAPAKLRKSKNVDVYSCLKTSNQAYADQGKVWDRVAESHKDLDMSSPTQNLSDAVNDNRKAFETFTEKFRCDENVNGIALFTDEGFVGLDLFNSKEVYKEYFPKILKGAALQFINAKKTNKKIDESELKYKLLETMDLIEAIEKSSFKGMGVGTEERFQNDNINGFELIYENKLIHLTAMR